VGHFPALDSSGISVRDWNHLRYFVGNYKLQIIIQIMTFQKFREIFKEFVIPIITMIFWEIVFMILVFSWIWIPLAIYGEYWKGPKWVWYIGCRAYGVPIKWKELQ